MTGSVGFRMAGRRTATLVSLLVFAFGFLGMAVYSLTGPAYGSLPTIWQSWGGTLGDMLLPAVVYSLVRGAQLLGPARIHPSSYALAAVGGLGGAGSQAAWLLDADPYVNWMLVAPHTFSPIGWYHFGYLIIVASTVAGTAWELLVRARGIATSTNSSPEDEARLRFVLGSRATAVAITSFLCFAAAVASDSISSLESLASMGTSAGAVAPLVVAIMVATVLLGPRVRLLVRPTAWAVVIATAIIAAVGTAARAV